MISSLVSSMHRYILRTLRTALLFTVVLVLCTAGKRPALTIFMIGDSTMANKSIANGNLERGWGMVLQGFFTDRLSDFFCQLRFPARCCCNLGRKAGRFPGFVDSQHISPAFFFLLS